MVKKEKIAETRDWPPQKGDGLTFQFNFTMLPDALQDDESMGRRELAVYWAIARHADKNGEGAFPSIARLARLSRYSRQAVIDALGELAFAGWIDRERRRKADGGKTSNLYIVRREGHSRVMLHAAMAAGKGGVVQPVDQGSQVAGLPSSSDLTLTISPELEPSNKSSRPSAGAEKKGMIPGFRHCTDHFFELFRAHYKGTKSPGWGAKESGLLKKDLARVQGDDRYLRVAMEVFFDGDHRKTQDFAADAGYEYGVFHGCLGGMLEHMRREELHGRADW